MKKPNILWICTDQQRWDTLGCYGNEFVNTPNIDRLAAEGARFENAFSQCPVCTPSRSSFLTGRYPRTTRCRQNGQDIPEDEVLVTKRLADNGYHCGLSGKLHISACSPDVTPRMERRIDDGYKDFHWSHHPMDGWGTDNEYWAWLEGKGAKFETPMRPDSAWVKEGMPEDLHQTTWCAEKAIDFMDKRADDNSSWAFSINFFDPHHPFDPPTEYLEPYLKRLEEIPLPNYVPGELDNKPSFQMADHKKSFWADEGLAFSEMSDREHRMVRASYWAMIDLVDKQVGRLLDHLDATGMREDTIVIFMSDHGEMIGDHGIYLKGPYFYEPSVHVPLIVNAPGRVAPQVCSELVELTDIAPMLLEACGIEEDGGMQGHSLWPLINGGDKSYPVRNDVYSEYYHAMPWADSEKPFLTMVRGERYKIIVDHEFEGGELYDLEEDPNESVNLWVSPQYQSVRMKMLERVCQRLARTVDPLPLRKAVW